MPGRERASPRQSRRSSADKLVGMPTETVYGLAGDAKNPVAVAAIFAAKDRPRFNPLIVHTASLEARAPPRRHPGRRTPPRRRLLAGTADAGCPQARRRRIGRPGHRRRGYRCAAGPGASCRPRPDRGVRRAARRPERQPLGPCQPDDCGPCRRRPRRPRSRSSSTPGRRRSGSNRRSSGSSIVRRSTGRAGFRAPTSRRCWARLSPCQARERRRSLPACSPRTTRRQPRSGSMRGR